MIGSQAQRINSDTTAATNTGNVLSGTQYEYVSVPSMLSLYLAENVGDVTAELVLGQRRVMPSSPVPMVAAGAGPRTNEDQVTKTMVMPGERIQLSYQGGVANSTVRALIVIDPIP